MKIIFNMIGICSRAVIDTTTYSQERQQRWLRLVEKSKIGDMPPADPAHEKTVSIVVENGPGGRSFEVSFNEEDQTPDINQLVLGLRLAAFGQEKQDSERMEADFKQADASW